MKEELAVIWAITKFRPYIDGLHFVVHSDHRPLRWLMSLKIPSGYLARWALSVQHYNFDIVYIPGKLNVLADLLSRHPGTVTLVVLIHHLMLDEKPLTRGEFRDLQMADPFCGKIHSNI